MSKIDMFKSHRDPNGNSIWTILSEHMLLYLNRQWDPEIVSPEIYYRDLTLSELNLISKYIIIEKIHSHLRFVNCGVSNRSHESGNLSFITCAYFCFHKVFVSWIQTLIYSINLMKYRWLYYILKCKSYKFICIYLYSTVLIRWIQVPLYSFLLISK